jgi:thiamine-monophosphate kinase
MIDISDGLGADAQHLASSSGVELRIGVERVPLAPGLAELAAAAGLDPLDLALAGGEDYELLVALPADRVDSAAAGVAAAGAGLTVIGEAVPGSGVVLSEPGGRARRPAGFDQLRPRAPGAPA